MNQKSKDVTAFGANSIDHLMEEVVGFFASATDESIQEMLRV